MPCSNQSGGGKLFGVLDKVTCIVILVDHTFCPKLYMDRYSPPSFWRVRIDCEMCLLTSSCSASVRPSVRPSVRMYQRLSHWTAFLHTGGLLSKSVEKLQIWVKSPKFRAVYIKTQMCVRVFFLIFSYIFAP
jgi:hypothetical protein